MNEITVVSSPSLDLSAIERATLQPSTKAKYKREIEKMHAAGINPSNRAALLQYAGTLRSSRKQFLKSALRLMLADFEEDLKANAAPVNIAQTQAALLRLDAMKSAVHVAQPKGTKAHTWLSKAQVYQLTSIPGPDLEGKRDYIVLGLLVGAGLRREELASLTFEAIKQQPRKGGKMRTVIEVTGKGNKTRVIPISDKLAAHLQEWQTITGGGRIARAMTPGGHLTDSMSAVAIFQLVRRYGKRIGVPTLAAHDMRRTYAQLGYEAGVPVTQISKTLGHSSISVTERYLDLSLDIESSASDFIPLA